MLWVTLSRRYCRWRPTVGTAVRAGVDAEGTRMAIVRGAAWMDQRRAGRDGTMERVWKSGCGRAGSEESRVARVGLVWRWIG